MRKKVEVVKKETNIIAESKETKKLTETLASAIMKEHKSLSKLLLVGIRTRGEFIARRIVKSIKKQTGKEIPLGILDIALYRDDVVYNNRAPVVRGSSMPHLSTDGLKGFTVILIDDVLFTGRTIRAALDALMDMGRAKKVQLAVLVDRSKKHREVPISADFSGIEIATKQSDSVRVHLKEYDNQENIVFITKPKKAQTKEAKS